PVFRLGTGGSSAFTALANAECTATQTDDDGAIRVVIAAEGRSATTAATSATATAGDAAPAAFRFTNYLPGSLPPTGGVLGGSLIAAILLLGAGSVLFAVEAARRRRAG